MHCSEPVACRLSVGRHSQTPHAHLQNGGGFASTRTSAECAVSVPALAKTVRIVVSPLSFSSLPPRHALTKLKKSAEQSEAL